MSVSREESSRINGAQSSGPISDEGKRRSSQNALKQGLFSKRRFIGDENPAEFDALVDSMAATHQPATPTEWLLIDRMAMARWRLGRLERAEAAQIESERNGYRFASEPDKWERYGGRSLSMRLPQISEEKLKAASADRDELIERSMSVPADFEKFVRLSAALNREFDSALRQLREEQTRRVDSLELQSTSRRRKSSADPLSSADPAVGEGAESNSG